MWNLQKTIQVMQPEREDKVLDVLRRSGYSGLEKISVRRRWRMEQIMLNIDSSVIDQIMTIPVTPNGNRVQLRIRVEYRPYVGKYFASVWDAISGEPKLLNFPVVASEAGALNDLLKVIAYKELGAMICYPILNETTQEDPTEETLDEYELLWGDSPWTN